MTKEVLREAEDKVILKEAVRTRGTTQAKLAEKIGMRSNALSMNMTRDRMSLDMFRRILNGLGYDVAVMDRETGRLLWKVKSDDAD